MSGTNVRVVIDAVTTSITTRTLVPDM